MLRACFEPLLLQWPAALVIGPEVDAGPAAQVIGHHVSYNDGGPCLPFNTEWQGELGNGSMREDSFAMHAFLKGPVEAAVTLLACLKYRGVRLCVGLCAVCGALWGFGSSTQIAHCGQFPCSLLTHCPRRPTS